MKTAQKQISLSMMLFMLAIAATNVFPQAPNPQDVINQLFNSLRNKVIADADKINQWKTEAENAAKKTVSDFTDCPSPAAQNLYNDLKQKKQKAETVKGTAEQADKDAIAARDECKRKTGMNVQCDSAYNGLSFKATAVAASATVNALNNAMNVLKNLKCNEGCNRTAKIVYPKLLTMPVQTMTGVMQGGNVQATATASGININNNTVATNRVVELTYCSAWDAGLFQANWDIGNGELNANVRAKLPKCKEVKKMPCCSEWDLNVVLPQLKKFNLIPPNVKVSDLTISIPNKTINLISGVRTASCSQPVKVCKRLQQTNTFISITPNNSPLSVSLANFTCAEWVDVGCSSPVLGLEPISNSTSVPDITRVKFTWQGLNIQSGSVEVDMTRPEFKAACKKGCTPVTNIPEPNPQTGTLDISWACLEPRLVNVVANP